MAVGEEKGDALPEDIAPNAPEAVKARAVEGIDPEDPEIQMEDLLAPGVKHDASPRARAASRAILALSRAARAFTLYDPSNEAIRVFLEAIQTSFRAYLQNYGPLPLLVRPFQLLVEEEIVYDVEERERSLAFKLFRDGVRRLTIFEDVEWTELLRLLEILSIRYTGIRLNEDDIVTLLWKAGFDHVEVEAVEGFVPEEDDYDADATLEAQLFQDVASAGDGGVKLDKSKGKVEQGEEGKVSATGLGMDASALAMDGGVGEGEEGAELHSGAVLPEEMKSALSPVHPDQVEGMIPPTGEIVVSAGEAIIPPDMDLPSPKLPRVGVLVFTSVDEVFLDSVRAEDGARALPEDCLQLVDQLLSMVESPRDPLTTEEVVPLLHEIRDFLLTEGQLANLLRLLTVVADFSENFREDESVQRLVKSFANEQALGRLIRSVPSSAVTPPEEFFDLLDKLPGDHLSTLMNLLEQERASGSRRITRQLIEHFMPGREGWVIKRLVQMRGSVAADLLRALASVNAEAAWEVVMEFAANDDVDTQFECLHVLEKAGHAPTVRTHLFRLLHAKEEQIRIRTLQLLIDRADAQDHPQLLNYLNSSGSRRLSQEESMKVGSGLVATNPAASLEMFRDWIRPKGFLRKLRPTRKSQDWAAIGGLEFLEEEEADELLKILANRVDGETHKHCMQARVRRHRRIRGDVDV